MTTAIADLVRQCFDAFQTADRTAIERLLADDFTFCSPYDDHIDRATYFERCWPAAGSFRSFELEQVVVEGNACFVLYQAATKKGKRFRNAERFTVAGDRIRTVEVFFGRTLEDSGRSDEESVRAVVDAQCRAIRTKDPEAVMALQAPEVRSFDMLPPMQNLGAGTIRERVLRWFDSYEGPIGCEVRELEVAVATDVAFVTGMEHFLGTQKTGAQVDMWTRLTLGLRKIDGEWKVVHQHVSVPFDMEKGKPLMSLAP